MYQHLARRYQIRLESLMWEPEVIPNEAQWRSLRSKLDTHNAEWMIWEAEPALESIDRLQSLGLDSLVFDPSANTPEDGDFIAVMKRNIIALEQAFQPKA